MYELLSDDDVGPGVVFKAPNSTSTTGNNLEERDPLGGVMVGGQSGGVEEESAGPLSTSVSGEGTGKLQREEWMLTPGERMPFGGTYVSVLLLFTMNVLSCVVMPMRYVNVC
jgi:hypothetical protein